MLNFCWVRMVGAFKIHLIPSMKLSCLLKQLRNNVLGTVKNILCYVNYLKSYVLFRVSRADELMISAAMEACVVKKSIVKQEALIPHISEWSAGPGLHSSRGIYAQVCSYSCPIRPMRTSGS